jgi:predicted acylesterase/phospholipase RssA
MQFGTDGKFGRASIWLALSGGGFRAAIFHYGCLKRLHEVGLLSHVYAISATSGGSIVAALLARYWGRGKTYDDRERDVFLFRVDWEDFERRFLEVVQQGIFAPTAMLVLAYVLYVFGIVVALFHDAGLLIVAAGVLFHFALAALLIRERAYASSEDAARRAKLDARFADADWAKPSMRRFWRMLFAPSYLRWQTLNLRVFSGELLTAMHTRPKVYLTAVDLNSGEEMVFTSGLVARLDVEGCRSLWDQKPFQGIDASRNIDIAQAVCASSAFPPLFRPVSIVNEHGIAGVFVDGGVFDNFALNVPKALSVHIHRDRGQRYDGLLPSFRETTSFILAMDGGKAPVTKRRTSWSRIATTFRLPEILIDQQYAGAMQATLDLDRIGRLPTRIVGLNVGFPHGSTLDDEELDRSIGEIRTHLDSFSREECAVIAYSGYLWVETLLQDRPSLTQNYANAQWTPPLDFAAILPEHCGQWDSSLASVRKHMRFSKWRVGLVRKIGRWFAALGLLR